MDSQNCLLVGLLGEQNFSLQLRPGNVVKEVQEIKISKRKLSSFREMLQETVAGQRVNEISIS